MGIDLSFALVFVAALTTATITWFVFLVSSVWRMEKRIMEEGKARPCLWDGLGGRAFWYSWTIALPARVFNSEDDSFLNTADVKRYTTLWDYVLAWVLMVSSYTMVGIGVISLIFGIG